MKEQIKNGLIKLHAFLSVIVLLLTIIRSWFFKVARPKNLKTGSKFNDKLIVFIHNAFYVLLITIAASGIATMVLGGYGDAIINNDIEIINPSKGSGVSKFHTILATIMMILLVMHIVGVIKHYIQIKENTLKRIS